MANIVFEQDGFYVNHLRGTEYTVFVPSNSGLYAESDSSYADTEEGRSLAIARCKYLADRFMAGVQ